MFVIRVLGSLGLVLGALGGSFGAICMRLRALGGTLSFQNVLFGLAKPMILPNLQNLVEHVQVSPQNRPQVNPQNFRTSQKPSNRPKAIEPPKPSEPRRTCTSESPKPQTHRWSSVLGELNVLPFASHM